VDEEHAMEHAADEVSNGTKRSKSPQRQRNANGQGTIYWSEKRKRWVAEIYDINHKRIPTSSELHDEQRSRQLKTLWSTQILVANGMP
jgi:hypothetical protein